MDREEKRGEMVAEKVQELSPGETRSELRSRDPDFECPLNLVNRAKALLGQMEVPEALPPGFERQHLEKARTEARIRREYTNCDELLQKRLPQGDQCDDIWQSEEPCTYILLNRRYTVLTGNYITAECPHREKAEDVLYYAGKRQVRRLLEQWFENKRGRGAS